MLPLPSSDSGKVNSISSHLKKNRKGNRQFTKQDIENVRLIYHLVKEKGFTLQGAKDMLKNDSGKIQNDIDMLDSLKKVRSFLEELRQQL